MTQPIVLLLSAALLASCSDRTQLREVERIPSPDGAHDAVILHFDADATVSQPVRVYLVKREERTDGTEPVFFADKLTGLEVHWANEHEVHLACEGARIWNYRSFASIALGAGRFRELAVTLTCGRAHYQRGP